jgi:translation initiation factor IF-3
LWGRGIEKELRINEEITARVVRLIMEDGRSVGDVPIDQARYLAQQYGLDLVEIAPKAIPPVVRLLDYNKYRYQREKHARLTGKNTKGNEMKEIRLGFKTDEHDLATKAKRAKQFLEQGNFVRVFVLLRGRENMFAEKAKQTLEQFQQLVGAAVEQPVAHVGNKVTVILKKNKDAKS